MSAKMLEQCALNAAIVPKEVFFTFISGEVTWYQMQLCLMEIPLWFQFGAFHYLDGTIFSPFSLKSGLDFKGFL